MLENINSGVGEAEGIVLVIIRVENDALIVRKLA